MTPDERAALEAELVLRQRQAGARRDQPGFAANVAALDARIAEIEELLSLQTEDTNAGAVQP